MVDTGTEDTAEDTAMVATEDTTTARGPLMLSLRLRLMLSPPPLLSPDMDTMAMDMDTALTGMAMLLLTPTDIMVTTARGPLMLSPPPAEPRYGYYGHGYGGYGYGGYRGGYGGYRGHYYGKRSADAEPGYGYYGRGYGGYHGGYGHH